MTTRARISRFDARGTASGVKQPGKRPAAASLAKFPGDQQSEKHHESIARNHKLWADSSEVIPSATPLTWLVTSSSIRIPIMIPSSPFFMQSCAPYRRRLLCVEIVTGREDAFWSFMKHPYENKATVICNRGQLIGFQSLMWVPACHLWSCSPAAIYSWALPSASSSGSEVGFT
jgi:hypothetical protein